MRVLWLCNLILPDFAEEFGVKKNPYGGWMTGMLHALDGEKSYEIGLCFPIKDIERMRDGVINGISVYSFHNNSEYPYIVSQDRIDRFIEIIKQYKPDIVHIWGSEYAWCLEMVVACEKMGLLDQTVINIQGLVSVCAQHFLSGITDICGDVAVKYIVEISKEKDLFEKRGINEETAIKKVKHVVGRTEWDKACITMINPCVEYNFVGEILRDEIYGVVGQWNYDKCDKHRIFVSQASYPIKGFHYLLTILPDIIKKYPDVKVYVGGNDIVHAKEKTAYAILLSELIETLDLREYVIFLGGLDCQGMIEQYKKANVFLSVSSIENSSNSLCEAMLVGTPVVSSYVGGVPSFVFHNENGLLYPESELLMLEYMILELFENKKLCEKISENAVNSMSEYVSKEKAVKGMMNVYEKIYSYTQV